MADIQILTLSCRDRPGIAARVVGCLYDHGGNILEARQFDDLDSGDFFMRAEFDCGNGDPAASRATFTALGAER